MCISAAIFECVDEEDYQETPRPVNTNWDRFYL
jgi:hypothetical protein